MNGPSESPLPLHAAESTSAPPYPTVRFSSGAPKKLTEADWSALSNDLYLSLIASITARGALEVNLKEWSDAYDLIVAPKDFPFLDSSNVSLPYLPSQLESMVAYIAGTVLVPRMYLVTGNTPQAAAVAYQIEKFYNADLQRLRPDGTSYFSRHLDWLHLSMRDGTAVMEVLWNRKRRRSRAVSYVPKTHPKTGIMQTGPDGEPLWEERTQDLDLIVKDYADLTPILLKEFILIPDEALSIEEAVGCGRVEWLYEDRLDRMVRSGLLDAGEVERALHYAENGTSDVAPNIQGYYDVDVSRQLGIGQAQGTLASKFFKNRGPLKVWRIHSRQFDMNGDGLPEENVFWVHELSERMLGWMPYDYATGQRPFFAFSPFPRPDRFYGFSLCERLAGVQAEMNSLHNARNDQIALRLSPPLGVKSGSELLNRRGQWRPGNMIELESMSEFDPSLKILQQQDVPVSSWQEESLLKQYGTEYTGLAGGAPAGRRTATEARSATASAGTRLNLIAMRFRVSCAQVINFVHALNKQYLQGPPTTQDAQGAPLSVPLAVFAQDVTIGIAGATDPIDSTTRRNENMTLFELLARVPLVAQNPMRMWYALRALLESFGRPDVYQLIGTEQEVQQEIAAQKAQAQAQQQQAQQMAAQHEQTQQAQAQAANTDAQAKAIQAQKQMQRVQPQMPLQPAQMPMPQNGP